MAEHEFRLTVRGELTDARLDALVDAGCDDATFSARDELIFAEFVRAAPSLADAVLSAIADVEQVDGLQVLRVDPDEHVWAAEIAERTGRSRQSVNLLINGRRGPGGFPPPVSHATRNPLWRWSEVADWVAGYEGRPADPERSLTIGAVNGALEARRALRTRAGDTRQLRRGLQRLIAS